MPIKSALKNQYRASLTMLYEVIDGCPPELWADAAHRNPYWRVAYHTLYYAHLYLMQSETEFVPWEHHRPGANRLGAPPDPSNPVTPYSVEELRGYCRYCIGIVDVAVDRLDLSSPESGYSWYQMPKLEHQLVNLRHVEHHTGQLAERLRRTADRGLAWVKGA
ncbi:MAG: DinB family protein [Gemmatimonadetes bacterium]|nr:DinB family protein [Gemmatimonadota bacterium]